MEFVLDHLWFFVFVVIVGLGTWVLTSYFDPRGSQKSASDKFKKRAKASAVIATVVTVLGVAASLEKVLLDAAGYRDTLLQREHADIQATLVSASSFPKEQNEMARVLLISSLEESVRSQPKVADSVVHMLVEFIRARRDIDANRGVLNEIVPRDIQAAIHVIGARPTALSETEYKLRSAKLNFRRLALMGADFSEGDFTGASFEESNLRYTNFRNSKVSRANFTAATFDYWCVPWVQKFSLDEVHPNDLFYAAVATWYPAKVQSSFAGAIASAAMFYSSNLVGVDFSGANLDGAKFEHADLTFADLTGASYQEAEVRQGCRSGPVRPNSLLPVLHQCSGDPDVCGSERVWNAAPQSNPLPRTFKY